MAGQEVDGGAAGDVVEADRAGGGVGDGLEVADEALLRGLVVVGRGREDVVDAEGAHSPGLVHGAAGVVAGGAGHHRHPAGRGLDDGGHDPLALAVVQGLGLAGGAARHEEVDPFGDLPLDERAGAPGSRPRRSRVNGVTSAVPHPWKAVIHSLRRACPRPCRRPGGRAATRPPPGRRRRSPRGSAPRAPGSPARSGPS